MRNKLLRMATGMGRGKGLLDGVQKRALVSRSRYLEDRARAYIGQAGPARRAEMAADRVGAEDQARGKWGRAMVMYGVSAEAGERAAKAARKARPFARKLAKTKRRLRKLGGDEGKLKPPVKSAAAGAAFGTGYEAIRNRK